MLNIVVAALCSVLVSVLLKLARRFDVDVGQAVAWNYVATSALTLAVLQPALPPLQQANTPWLTLAALGLLLPHGAQPVWALRVGAPGQPPLRYASALKLPAVLYDGPEPCPVYAGTLCAAAGVRAP